MRNGAAIHDMCGNTMVGNATDSAFTDVAAACAPAPAPATVQVPVYVPTPVPATYCVVPQLKGLTLAKVKAAVTKAGCTLGKVSRAKAAASQRGKVLSQTIPAKIEVRTGTKVAVKLGK